MIGCLDGRASPLTLEITSLYGPKYDGVQDFVTVVIRVAKSQREIKLSAENACGDKNMAYSLIYSLIKAGKDKKSP
jgi:hypothetical protein